MTEIEKKLLALAAESANLTPAEVLSQIAEPTWETHCGSDWELYLPRELQPLWQGLGINARLCLFISCFGQASCSPFDLDYLGS
jgi:hypothetical protein